MSLSEYVSLDGVAKSRYFDKLKVLWLAAKDDPYASGDFQNAMWLWQSVEFSHTFCLHRVPWSLHTTGAAAMEAAQNVQLFQEWIRQDHAGVHQAIQDNTLAAVPEIPHFHGPDESTLEIVVHFELLPLQQLLSCINSRALDEVQKMWPNSIAIPCGQCCH